MFCKNPCDIQCKYGLGHPSKDTLNREEGQCLMSIYVQSGSTQGIMTHKWFPDKNIQWCVVIELPGWTDASPKCPIMPWFLDVVS